MEFRNREGRYVEYLLDRGEEKGRESSRRSAPAECCCLGTFHEDNESTQILGSHFPLPESDRRDPSTPKPDALAASEEQHGVITSWPPHRRQSI